MIAQRIEPQDWLAQILRADLGAERTAADTEPSAALTELAVAVAAANRGDETGRIVRLYRLEQPLAADEGRGPRTSVRLQSDDPAQRWTVTQLYQEGDSSASSFYLIFECRGEDLERYRGCRVTIVHDQQPFSLGQVDDTGVAADLFEQIDMVINRRLTLVGISERGSEST